MSEAAIAGVFIAGILALNIFGLVAYLRGQRIEKVRLQRVRAAEQKHQAHEETRRAARERAQIAYPELLDPREADRDPIGPFGGYGREDLERIRAASELEAEGEDEALDIWCGFNYGAFDNPKNGVPSKFLNGPVPSSVTAGRQARLNFLHVSR